MRLQEKINFHIWPKSSLQNARTIKQRVPSASADVIKEMIASKDSIVNLQLLNAIVNQEKQDMPFNEWGDKHHPDKADSYYDLNCIPVDSSYEYGNFLTFIDNSRKTPQFIAGI